MVVGYHYFWFNTHMFADGLVQPTTNYIVNDQQHPRPRPRRGCLARMPSSRLSDAARPSQALPTSKDLSFRTEKKKTSQKTDAWTMGRWYVYLPIHEWWNSLVNIPCLDAMGMISLRYFRIHSWLEHATI